MTTRTHPPCVVSIQGLSYSYPTSSSPVLSIPSLEIAADQMTAIVGGSGSGKSTLVEIMAGTLKGPYHGTVTVLGRDVSSLHKDADRQRHVRRIGLVTQDYALMSDRTVEESLVQDLKDAEVPTSQHHERIAEALARVGLTGMESRPVTALSGGQRQRVAIARMLARHVDLVIADEPTANLDPDMVDSILVLLREIATATPVIIVTHDPSVARRCDRVITLLPFASHDMVHVVSTPPPHLRGAVVIAGCIVVAGAVTLGVHVWTTHVTPTPTAASGVSLPVAQCTISTNNGGAHQATGLPEYMSTALSPSHAKGLSAYGDGTILFVGPAQWNCSSHTYNGEDTITLSPPFSAHGTPRESEISLEVVSGSSAAATTLCPFFAIAPSPGQLAQTCAQPVPGQSTTKLSSSVIEVVDPPGVHGSGALSGEFNATDDVIAVWLPHFHLSPTGVLGFGFVEDCVMSAQQQTTCQTILNVEIARYDKGGTSVNLATA